MDVRIVPYDLDWPAAFAVEAASIRGALHDDQTEVHHIGSTAIPGVFAKPIIDILLVVPSLELLDSTVPLMEALGYESLGELGISAATCIR